MSAWSLHVRTALTFLTFRVHNGLMSPLNRCSICQLLVFIRCPGVLSGYIGPSTGCLNLYTGHIFMICNHLTFACVLRDTEIIAFDPQSNSVICHICSLSFVTQCLIVQKVIRRINHTLCRLCPGVPS